MNKLCHYFENLTPSIQHAVVPNAAINSVLLPLRWRTWFTSKTDGSLQSYYVGYFWWNRNYIAFSFCCVCVLGNLFEAFNNSHRVWTEASPLFCTQNKRLVAASSPNVKGHFKHSSQHTALLPNHLFKNWSSNPMTSLHWRICYPSYGIRIVNLFLPRDAFCTCRRVKQHTKPNHLPEDLGGGGWFMSLAQIAMLELFLREKLTFLGQIQTTHFLPGGDLTLLSCARHTTQSKACTVHFQGSQRCQLVAIRCFICLGNGALWSASTRLHQLAKTTRFPRIKQSNNK